MGLAGESVRKLMSALEVNSNISDLHVDMSDNDLGAKVIYLEPYG